MSQFSNITDIKNRRFAIMQNFGVSIEKSEEIDLEKAKRDLSKLQKKTIIDSRGHKTTRWVKTGEKSKSVNNTKKEKSELTSIFEDSFLKKFSSEKGNNKHTLDLINKAVSQGFELRSKEELLNEAAEQRISMIEDNGIVDTVPDKIINRHIKKVAKENKISSRLVSEDFDDFEEEIFDSIKQEIKEEFKTINNESSFDVLMLIASDAEEFLSDKK